MATAKPYNRAAFARVQGVIDRVAAEWLRNKNILQVSPCIKVTGGVARPGALAIGVYVAHKLSREALTQAGLEPIPAEVEGIPTDVIDTHQPAHGSVDERATRSAMFDTLVGGIAVGNGNLNAYGTLATTLLKRGDDTMVGLTNEHVLVFDGDGHVGDDVEQPRFYLQSEVSLEPAACCPEGQLRYRGVDNPIVDAAAAVFAAAAIAAAASDRIDPHRRGQAATRTDPGERTQREVVRMEIRYPELPLPGTPFRTDVAWRYERHTDRRVLTHDVSESQYNHHSTKLERLITDRGRYRRGDLVRYFAALGPDRYSGRCNYLVTAAALSPSHRQAHKLVLRPWDPGDDKHAAAAARGGRLLNELRTEMPASQQGYCLFSGEIWLPTDTEVGMWSTYLFAHTLNDVPAGTDPLEGAMVIGGLPVTNNFVDAGRTTHILYGARCNVELRSDGQFEVADESDDKDERSVTGRAPDPGDHLR